MKKLFKKSIASLMIIMLAIYMLPIYAFASKETVYTKAKSSGEGYKTIVTTKNNKYTKQEEASNELPLETKITYKLNDKEISAEELAGKSGKVSIKIEYINKSEKQVMINGKEEIMYTPFVVAVGTIINNNNNENIEVKNGQIIEEGDKTIVAGIVMPGLSESLNLTGELATINIPSSIEITMDTENFEMKNIISYATPKLFDDNINWDKFDSIFSASSQLQSSIEQIEEGANSLKDGVVTLDAGVQELKNGTENLNNGANQLAEGSEKLSGGALNLSNGANAVNDGAQELSTGLTDLNSNVGILQTKMGELSQGISTINAGTQNLQTQVNAMSKKMSEYASEEQLEQLNQLINANTQLLATVEEGTPLYDTLSANINALNGEKELLGNVGEKIPELAGGVKSLADGMSSLNEQTKNLPTTMETLAGGVNALATGAQSLAEGTSSLNEGAQSLAQGANDLNSGAITLANGTETLNNGVGELAQGSTTLSDGTSQLADGIHKYNAEGISRITKFINGDLYNLKIRAMKLEELSNEYNKFKSNEPCEDIKFITIFDSVGTTNKKEEE